MKQGGKIKILILLLIFSFGFTAPFYISQGAGAIAYITKEFGLDLVARAIARKLLNDLGNNLVTSINNLGTDGGKNSPTFIQDWKKYLGEAQTIGENQFRSQLTYSINKGLLCDDLKSPLAKAFQVNSNTPYIDIGNPDKNAELKQHTLIPYQSKIKCTVPDKTRADFQKDFVKGGGWDTWSRLLEPQNNLAGALSLSLEELGNQRTSQEGAQQSEAIAGQGFQGVKSACQGTGPDAKCIFLGQTVTPAKILGESAATYFDKESNWLLNSHELSEVLISMVSAMVNKLANFATKGLVTNASDLINQTAPNFLPQAQQDEQNLQNAAKKSSGESCTDNSECQSNFCSSGVCE